MPSVQARACPVGQGGTSTCAVRARAAVLIMASAIVLVCLAGAYYWYIQSARAKQVREGYAGFTDQAIKSEAIEKSDAYTDAAIKWFYSSGESSVVSSAKKSELVFFYFTILDTLCNTIETSKVQSISTRLCDSYNINTMSMPRDLGPSISSTSCNTVELAQQPTSIESALLRIHNHDYVLSKSCLRLPSCVVERKTNTRYRIIISGLKGLDVMAELARESTNRLVLMRPLFLTSSMSYLYAINYDADVYKSETAGSTIVDFDNSVAERLVIYVDKMSNKKIYETSNMQEISAVYEAEVHGTADCSQVIKDLDLSDPYITFEQRLNEVPPVTLTITAYYLTLRNRITTYMQRSQTASLIFSNVLTADSKVLLTYDNAVPNAFQGLTVRYDAAKRVFQSTLKTNNNNNPGAIEIPVPADITKFGVILTYTTDTVIVYMMWQSPTGQRGIKHKRMALKHNFAVDVDKFDEVAKSTGTHISQWLPESGGTTCVLASSITFANRV